MELRQPSDKIDLSEYERVVYTGNDGYLEKIVQSIPLVNRYYVEFGAGKGGTQNNTLYLKRQYGFDGLWIDARYPDEKIPIYGEFMTAENAADVFRKYDVPKELAILSVDIDRNDWYVLRAVLEAGYRPQVIVVEYNSSLGPRQDAVVVYDATGRWDGTDYFGGSIVAFSLLGERFGYSLVVSDSNGVDLTFVRKELSDRFVNAGNVGAIYRRPNYTSIGGHPHRRGCLWCCAREMLK